MGIIVTYGVHGDAMLCIVWLILTMFPEKMLEKLENNKQIMINNLAC